MEHIKEHGQYFTKDKGLQEKAFSFIKNKPRLILEPSCGAGHLVVNFPNKKTKFDCYELDGNIEFLINKDNIKFGNFLEQNIMKYYTSILANPPYVKTKKGNLYIDFIERCFNLLKDNGELVFIIPSDFFKLTCASKLLQTMIKNGNFTHIYHPNNENLFDNATIDVIVFRYVKTKELSNIVLYNDKEMFVDEENGIVTFNEVDTSDFIKISDYFKAFVGMVTGKEVVYKNKEIGNFNLFTDKDIITKYIFTKSFPTDNTDINKYLLKHKNDLIQRKIKKFNENNWFEWGAPRNYENMKNNLGKKCIYIRNITRKSIVAFRGTVQFFGAKLIMLLPLNDSITDEHLDNIITYLNSDEFKNVYTYSKRFKIGQKQILNSKVPKFLNFHIKSLNIKSMIL